MPSRLRRKGPAARVGAAQISTWMSYGGRGGIQASSIVSQINSSEFKQGAEDLVITDLDL
jgi:hypothetical protein